MSILILGAIFPGVKASLRYADAGYDSEPNHELLRDEMGITSIIPPKAGRPTTKPAKGKYRRLMQRLFKNIKRTNYGQRWQVETVMSMLKRNLGHALTGRSYHAHNRDILLHCFTHNVMILRREGEVFYRACQEPYSLSRLSCIRH